MTIPAIPSLIAAIGGKIAPLGLGDIVPETGLPLDFAALLAEQIPADGQAVPSLLIANTAPGIPAVSKPDGELLSEIIARVIPSKDGELLPISDKLPTVTPATEQSAETVLAALAPNAKPGAISPTIAPEGEKKTEDKGRKSAPDSDTIPIDPGMAAQYIVPLATAPVQNRLPDTVDRNKLPLPEKAVKADSLEADSKEGRSAQSERMLAAANGGTAASSAPVTSAAQAGEPRISPRSESANAAILAGDANPGNSGNTPAFASALAAAGTSGASTATAPPTQQATVNTSLHSPNWSQDFGSKIVWLAKNDHQVAQISINPPQLGPVQISISISGDQATAVFASPHPEVRQAIQESLSQLREMFSTAGISLGQTNVGSHMPSQNREAAFQFANEARSSGENAILSPDSHASTNPAGMPIQRGRGLVDLFA